MTNELPSRLADDELLTILPTLAGRENEATARLIAHLAELETRGLHVPAGYASLFTYCHERLGYSEDAAYNRKTAAQVARRYPAVIEKVAKGELGLTAIRLLAPVLTDANWEMVLAEAARKPIDEVRKLVARLAPQPYVPSTIRKLPLPGAASPHRGVDALAADDRPLQPTDSGAAKPTTPAIVGAAGGRFDRRPTVTPTAPDRYRAMITMVDATEKKLRRAQQLLKREIPGGDLDVIFDRALDLLLADLERRKHGRAARPKPMPESPTTDRRGSRSRHVPRSVRHEVVTRDDGQCTFVGPGGRRCTERAYVEYHHGPVPFAHGGPAMAGNIALLCSTHNRYEGRRIFGDHLPREVREARALYDASWSPDPSAVSKRSERVT